MRQNGQAYLGLVMLTIVALKVLLHNKVPLDKQKDIILLFWRRLVLNDMMNLRENTESTLQLMDERIVEFLVVYKKCLVQLPSFHPKLVSTRSSSMLQSMQLSTFVDMVLVITSLVGT